MKRAENEIAEMNRGIEGTWERCGAGRGREKVGKSEREENVVGNSE